PKLPNIDAKHSAANTDRSGSSKQPPNQEPSLPKTPFTQLFRYSTFCDRLWIFIAICASIISGAALPINSIVFGRLVDTIGHNTQRVTRHFTPADQCNPSRKQPDL